MPRPRNKSGLSTAARDYRPDLYRWLLAGGGTVRAYARHAGVERACGQSRLYGAVAAGNAVRWKPAGYRSAEYRATSQLSRRVANTPAATCWPGVSPVQ